MGGYNGVVEGQTMIDDMSRPATDVRNHPGARGCKPGERSEPLAIEWDAVKIVEEQVGVLFRSGVVGVSNGVGHSSLISISGVTLGGHAEHRSG